MTIDPKKAQVARIVCERFTSMHGGTQRQPLVVAIKDGILLDQMVTHSLLREEENRTVYFPTLGTFALLPDSDPKLHSARMGMVQILHTLQNVYEVDGPRANVSPSELLDAVRKRYDEVDPEDFKLGLYLLDFPCLGAVQGYARDNDHLGIRWFTVSERIMMIDDPELKWSECVELCRLNAQLPDGLPKPIQASVPTQPAQNKSGKRQSWIPDGWMLGSLIGEGGQGRTYKVKRISEPEGDSFVFKRLKNADRAARFQAEIKALRALNHPGILRIIESGTVEDKPYYIAEYCQNGDLSKRNPKGTTTVEKLLLFRQICAAIAATHSANIVHRDIKPANILVRADGMIAVGDFGLCLDLNAEERLTLTEEAVGARNYVAPELADGRRDDVTAAADVYSLGKLLYFLFAGRSFAREDHHDPAYDLTHPLQGQPEDGIQFVYEILDKSIVKNPESRFQDAQALLSALDGVIRRTTMNAHVLDLKVPQLCLYCLDGEYQLMQGSQATQYSFTLACRRCGNIQHFGAPYNGWSAWWMKR